MLFRSDIGGNSVGDEVLVWVVVELNLDGVFSDSNCSKVGHFLKLAVWFPWQFEHLGSWVGVLLQSFAECSSAHFTHLGGCPQCRLEWPNL